MGDRCTGFRRRLTSGESIVGTFMKTPSSIVAEVLGLTSLDAVTIDVEHAPFGRLELDQCVGALRATDMPSLVRVADDSATQIRNSLDSGATGIVVPHVVSADQAAAIVSRAQFGDGGRGYAGSPRAAGYTTKSMQDHLSDSREQTTVVLQIEDLSALDRVSDIAAVDGVDCLFIGRVDLAVAIGEPVSSAAVIDAVKGICAACTSAGTTVGMFTPNLDEIPMWRDLGASLFLLSSDQSLMISGANQLGDSIR